MIWCVEDDSRIREIAIYALKSAGFEVKGFEDGRAFWEALKLEKPKLILLDIVSKVGIILLNTSCLFESLKEIVSLSKKAL